MLMRQTDQFIMPLVFGTLQQLDPRHEVLHLFRSIDFNSQNISYMLSIFLVLPRDKKCVGESNDTFCVK